MCGRQEREATNPDLFSFLIKNLMLKTRHKTHFAIFPMLCTRQKSTHCALTFFLVRSVNQESPLCQRRFHFSAFHRFKFSGFGLTRSRRLRLQQTFFSLSGGYPDITSLPKIYSRALGERHFRSLPGCFTFSARIALSLFDLPIFKNHSKLTAPILIRSFIR